MIILARSNSIVKDSRVLKYVKYMQDNDVDYYLLGWNRRSEPVDLNRACFFKRKSGYNVGGFKAAWHRCLWIIFCLKCFIHYKPDVIHGCDLDSAFPAVLYKLLFRRKVKIIFDIFDWFSATLWNQGTVLTNIFRKMEYLTTKYADYIFICEKERLSQIPYDVTSKLFVLPNIPLVGDEKAFKYIDENKSFSNDNITISYVGGLYGERFLSELLDLADEGEFNLLIAGYGDKGLEDRCLSLNNRGNIKYFGAVSYEKGLNIMYNSDVIFAMYCKSNPNHIYAAPNKFYEAMLLGKPLITTVGTIVGDKVVKENIGFAIEEDVSDLKKLVRSLNRDAGQLKTKGGNAYNLWNSKYHNFTSDFLNYSYNEICKYTISH